MWGRIGGEEEGGEGEGREQEGRRREKFSGDEPAFSSTNCDCPFRCLEEEDRAASLEEKIKSTEERVHELMVNVQELTRDNHALQVRSLISVWEGEGSMDAVVWAFRVCVCVMQNE